jgi:hypothetical protein
VTVHGIELTQRVFNRVDLASVVRPATFEERSQVLP